MGQFLPRAPEVVGVDVDSFCPVSGHVFRCGFRGQKLGKRRGLRWVNRDEELSTERHQPQRREICHSSAPGTLAPVLHLQGHYWTGRSSFKTCHRPTQCARKEENRGIPASFTGILLFIPSEKQVSEANAQTSFADACAHRAVRARACVYKKIIINVFPGESLLFVIS